MMMNLTDETLFMLLRLALGQRAQPSFAQDVSWAEVYRLSVAQEVAAIAFDGLQKALDIPETSRTIHGLGQEKFSWFYLRMRVEQNNMRTSETVLRLLDQWQSHGLETFVLKGMSFARYYPVPELRQCGDFDFFVRYREIARTACPAWRRADELVTACGGQVDSSWAKHSKGRIGGVSLENHRHLIGVKGSRQCRDNDHLLKSLLVSQERVSNPKYPNLTYPSWLFDALFCLYHARHHFLVENGITLRHVCDWAMIRQSSQARMGDPVFLEMVDRMGTRRFYEALNGVTDLVMGKTEQLNEKEALMLEDMLKPKPDKKRSCRFLSRLDLLGSIWHNAWKFRLYSDRSMPVYLRRYLVGYFFDED